MLLVGLSLEESGEIEEALAQLERPVRTEHAGSVEAGLDAIAINRPELLIVSSSTLEGALASSVECLSAAAPAASVLVCVGEAEQEVAIECMRRGALDYVARGVARGSVEPAQLASVLHFASEAGEGETRLRMLETAVLHVRDAVIIVEASPLEEPGPRIIFANRAFSRISGYPIEQVIGRSPRFLEGPETDQRTLTIIREALECGEPIRQRLLCYDRRARSFWADVEIEPVRDGTGAVTHHVIIQREVIGAARSSEQAAHEALHDALTGLPNRVLCRDRLKLALRRTERRDNSYAAVAMVDLDGFARVNEAHGERIGDRVLREVARRIESSIRPGDTVSRYEDDAFFLLLDDVVSTEQTQLVAGRVLAAIAEPIELEEAPEPIRLTASGGVLVAGPEAVPTDLVKAAEDAAYEARVQGGDRVVVHASSFETA